MGGVASRCTNMTREVNWRRINLIILANTRRQPFCGLNPSLIRHTKHSEEPKGKRCSDSFFRDTQRGRAANELRRITNPWATPFVRVPFSRYKAIRWSCVSRGRCIFVSLGRSKSASRPPQCERQWLEANKVQFRLAKGAGVFRVRSSRIACSVLRHPNNR